MVWILHHFYIETLRGKWKICYQSSFSCKASFWKDQVGARRRKDQTWVLPAVLKTELATQKYHFRTVWGEFAPGP